MGAGWHVDAAFKAGDQQCWTRIAEGCAKVHGNFSAFTAELAAACEVTKAIASAALRGRILTGLYGQVL